MSTNSTRKALIAAAVAITILAVSSLFLFPGKPASEGGATGTAPFTRVESPASSESKTQDHLEPRPGTAANDDSITEAILAQLDALTTSLSNQPDADKAAAIRALLTESIAEHSIAAILAYLRSGADAPTGELFEVGTSTFLIGAPSVRTLLLDVLGQIDSHTAADNAKMIFEQSDSADEWAVALRNYAYGNGHRTSESAVGDGYLMETIASALDNEAWKIDPTPGFLHALDFAVLAPDHSTLSRLAELSNAPDANRAVRYVAAAQLNRAAFRDLEGTLASIDATAVAPEQRALLHSYADLRDADQRSTIERYLASDLDEEELDRFATAFPNYGIDVTSHLVTQNASIDMADDAASVLEARDTVRRWREAGAFADKDGALARIETRLEGLVRSIERGARQN